MGGNSGEYAEDVTTIEDFQGCPGGCPMNKDIKKSEGFHFHEVKHRKKEQQKLVLRVAGKDASSMPSCVYWLGDVRLHFSPGIVSVEDAVLTRIILLCYPASGAAGRAQQRSQLCGPELPQRVVTRRCTHAAAAASRILVPEG